jgi:ATP-dependent Zn protease
MMKLDGFALDPTDEKQNEESQEVTEESQTEPSILNVSSSSEVNILFWTLVVIVFLLLVWLFMIFSGSAASTTLNVLQSMRDSATQVAAAT